MDKAQLLKAQILEQYRSVRQFAIAADMPYSTLATALDKGERGIETMAYGTVVSICEKLDIDPVDFQPYAMHGKVILSNPERQVLNSYAHLNAHGKERALELLEDFTALEKYKEHTSE